MIILGEFSPVLHKNIPCGHSLEDLTQALLLSTNNLCFYGEISKNDPRIITKYSS